MTLYIARTWKAAIFHVKAPLKSSVFGGIFTKNNNSFYY